MAKPSEVVHVGDSLDEDVAAAQSVGIRAVWLNRGENGMSPVEPWKVIRTLYELPPMLSE
jgi:putative hydrolase of the HAD superfamily